MLSRSLLACHTEIPSDQATIFYKYSQAKKEYTNRPPSFEDRLPILKQNEYIKPIVLANYVMTMVLA